MSYWVYENIPLRKARVHLASCSYCQDGRGIHGGGTRSTGGWIGPFETLDEADRIAASRKRADTRRCYECLPAAGEDDDIEQVEQTRQQPGAEEAKPWPWDKVEELHCALRLRWKPLGRVTVDDKGKLKFPAVGSVPGLYRIRVRTGGGGESYYVGESDNVQRRFGNYRNPGPTQQTSLRLNQLFRELLTAGGEISIALAEEVWIEASHGRAKADLTRKSLRCLFENFALAVEQVSEVESLNR